MNVYSTDSQLLHFDGLLNARELGGMPLCDGRVFKNRVAIRSDAPSTLSFEQAKRIHDYGVNLVIDLRSEAEVRHYGNVFERFEGVKFVNRSLFLGDPDNPNDSTMNLLRTKTLGDFYTYLVEELQEPLCDVFRLILNNDGVTFFHCAHGKDRTGVVAAILYLLAGASHDNIIMNYSISYEYMKSILDPLIEAREEDLKHTLRSDSHNMVTFLNYIDNKYNGSAEELLLHIGMTSDEIAKLKNKIVN